MTPAFEKLQRQLKQLPGVGYRSAERIALHLLVEKPTRLAELVASLEAAAKAVRRCERCGNLSEGDLCEICADGRRDPSVVCVVEPIQGVKPEDLNLDSLLARTATGGVNELILALSNDVEGEATCHYLTQHLPSGSAVKITRIGFGLPSGGGVLYADSVTLKSALDGRRTYS